jgi:hypothetical protein
VTTTAHISRGRASRLDAAAVRRSLLTVLLTALFSAAGLLVASPAAACSCPVANTATSFANADAVFTGTLVSRDVDHPEWPVISSNDPALHVFAVDGVFKGEVHELQGVVSAADGASCGLELSGDGPFVVFASRDPGLPEDQYRAGLCDGTTTVDPAISDELADLAGVPTPAASSGSPPAGGTAGLQGAGLSPVATALIGAGALVVVAIGGRVLRRRLRWRALQ